MRRWEFIAGLGSAAAWPLAARAQQPAMPVIGFLAVGPNGPNRWGAPFYQGLKEAGYVERQNVAIEYRGGPPRVEPLLELARELVSRQVAVILTSNDGPALAAKRATSTIPIVFFNIGSDPVKLGLVPSISQPGGNVTGASFDSPQLAAKRLDRLCQFLPTAATIAYLTGGPDWSSFEEEKDHVVAAAGALGRQLIVVECRSDDQLATSFATLVERGAGGLIVASIPLFGGTSIDKIVALAAQNKIPAMYPFERYAFRGGLMSYTRDGADEIRLAAGLVGQLLKGVMPADLPVRRSVKFQFIINNKTAEALGLTIPETLLATADQVIE
jgi:putative tryptophan/tyrosine transport system substrate-binding protein